MKKLQTLVLAVVAVALMLAGAAGVSAQDKKGWPETFIIGVYPGDNIEKAIAINQPLAAYFEKTLGVRTVIITGTSYNAVIEAMRAGRADAFEVGPFAYVLAAQVANAEALLISNYTKTVNLDVIPGYYSVMFTKKGSGIKSIADLKGRTFAFTDPASASGFLVPANDIMVDQKFTSRDQIDTFAGQVIFAGNHPAAVLAVAQGRVEAAATFDDNLIIQFKEAGVKICGLEAGMDNASNPFHSAMTREKLMEIYDSCPEGDIAVFHQSPLIPQTPFAINKDLPESFKTAVREALLNIAKDQALVNELERFYMDPIKVNPNLKSVDELFNPLRDIARNLNIDLTKR
jgi:phosphonate transport system substrate-binding protein